MFAKKVPKIEKVKKLFPLNISKYAMKMRRKEEEKYKTNRLKKSALPYMRILLNDEYYRKQNINIESVVCSCLILILFQ